MKILLTALLLLAMYGYGWVNVEAHTPCDDNGLWESSEPEPTCGYESAVNPLTGKYEANYVCK